MADLVLFDLAPSPNNVKVRLAMGYKRLPYERVPVDPAERAELIELSGQPLSPVLRHGSVVVFDSSAILRYLEANVAREPRLFSTDRDTLRAIERWESYTRGGGFGAPIGMAFEQFFAPERDAAKLAEAQALFAERCREVEAALTPAGFLVGDALSAADLCVVPLLCYGTAPRSLLSTGSPIARYLSDLLDVPADCPRTRRYVEQVMGYDA